MNSDTGETTGSLGQALLHLFILPLCEIRVLAFKVETQKNIQRSVFLSKEWISGRSEWGNRAGEGQDGGK
jgi:hypothetical protein